MEVEKKIMELETRLRKLENHVYHPPHIQKLLDHIRQVEVTTLDNLSSTFRKLQGGSLSRLYKALEKDPRFRIVISNARWSPTVIAYFGEDQTPKTIPQFAVDYFQRIPKGHWENRTSTKGKKYKILYGKEGTLAGIMKTYNINEEQAKEVMETIKQLFGSRIKFSIDGKAFRRLY